MIARRGQYQGAIALSSVLEADEQTILRDLPSFENESVFEPEADISTITSEFRKSHFISAAVVDGQGQLLGRITSEDAIAALQDEADHQLMSMAGLD